MSKLLIIGNTGSGTNPALLRAFKDAEVVVISATEAMNEFGKVARLIYEDVNLSQVELKPYQEIFHDAYYAPIPSKQKHPPRSFVNCGKDGKRRQW